MKKYLILSIMVLWFGRSTGQGIIIPSWTVIDSSSHGLSEAWGVDVDEQEHIYWAISNNNLNQGLDIYWQKFDVNGTPLWAAPVSYGGAGTQHAYVCNASDTSALYIGGRNCTGLVTTCDMLLLKIDKSDGALLWDRTNNFSADGYDEIDGLEIESDGIYCGGWGQELASSIYQSDIGLWKLDANGNTVWTAHSGTDSTAEHQDGHFVVDSSKIYAAGLWGGTGIANLYNGKAFLGSFSKSDGSLIDSTLFGHQSGNFNDIENALGMTSDGTYLYVTGYTTPDISNDWQIFVAKFDKTLTQIWYTDWGGTGTESARGISVENGKIYVAGLTESDSLLTGGDRDAVLLILDTDGNVLSYQTYGGAQKEAFQDIAVRNQHIYLSGTIEIGANTKQAMLLAIDDFSSSLEDVHTLSRNQFKVYPNPSSGNTHVEFLHPIHEKGVIRVYDAQGKQLIVRNFEGLDSIVSININQTGLFFMEVIFSDYRITKQVINHD